MGHPVMMISEVMEKMPFISWRPGGASHECSALRRNARFDGQVASRFRPTEPSVSSCLIGAGVVDATGPEVLRFEFSRSLSCRQKIGLPTEDRLRAIPSMDGVL